MKRGDIFVLNLENPMNKENIVNDKNENKESENFTMFNSRELNRALLELPSKGFVLFLTLVHLIVKFNSKNKHRRLSIEDLQEALPFKMSQTTLKKYLDDLRVRGFIKSFRDCETGTNVYKLMKPHVVGTKGYTKIKDSIFTETFLSIKNHDAIKVFVLCYVGVTAFSSDGFIKTLADLCRITGKEATKGNRDSIAKSLKELLKLKLINCSGVQKHRFQQKKLTISLSNEDAKVKSSELTQGHNQFERQQNTVSATAKASLSDTYIKKETKFKNQNISNINNHPEIKTQDNLKIADKVDNLIFKDFNYYEMDKLKNPFTEQSIKSLIKNTTLTVNQIQESIKRFSESLELKYRNNKYKNKSVVRNKSNIKNPVAFLINHLMKVGEYFPKKNILTKSSREEQGEKFNFYGLDELSNPLNVASISRILKDNNHQLSNQSVQLSVKRFSEYINSDFYSSEYTNPAAFICSHLINFGEYVPPEHFLIGSTKQGNEFNDDDFSEIASLLSVTSNTEIEEVSESTMDLSEMAKVLLGLLFEKEEIPENLQDGILQNHLSSAVSLIAQNKELTMKNLMNLAA